MCLGQDRGRIASKTKQRGKSRKRREKTKVGSLFVKYGLIGTSVPRMGVSYTADEHPSGFALEARVAPALGIARQDASVREQK